MDGYESYLQRHFAEVGQTPDYVVANFFRVFPVGNKNYEKLGFSKLLSAADGGTAWLIENEIYEWDGKERLIKVLCSLKVWEHYRAPLPYWAYSEG